jgi:ankyrin repeat protein
VAGRASAMCRIRRGSPLPWEVMNILVDEPLAVAVAEAIRRGDVETLRRLLRDHPGLATARIVDGRGVARTLLHVAADWPGHFPNGAASVALLIAAGADVNASVVHPVGSAETPLHWAASSDDIEVLDALLDGGADIEVPGAVFTGGAPMSDAVVFAQWRAARRLLERGAQTTIWQAAALGQIDRVRDLCAAVLPPAREQISNAFWNACRGGQRVVAEYLVGCGAELNRVGHDHKTPLDCALESGDADLITWLRARGARRAVELV